MHKKTKEILFLSVVLVSILIFFVVPLTTTLNPINIIETALSFSGNKSSVSFQPFNALSVIGTTSSLTCSLTNNGHVIGTDGSDTYTNSATNLFQPTYDSLVNPYNSKTLSQVKFIVYLYCQPFSSVLASAGYHPYLTGGTISMQFKAIDSSGTLRLVGSSQTISVNPAQVDVGTNSIPIATFTIPASAIQSAVGQKSIDFNSLNYAVTSGTLYFKQKLVSSQLTATYTMQPLTTNYWLTVKGTGQVTTPVPTTPVPITPTITTSLGCSGSICTSIPLSAVINYNLSYDDGSTQTGTSPNSVKVPTQFDLFKQDANKTPKLTDISLIVITKTTSPYTSSIISNPNLNIAGKVQVGGEIPFTIPSSDFTITPLNDITNGLVRISLPVNTLESEIISHLSQVYKNPQQTSVTVSVDGTFNISYQGKSGTGTISGLSWSFPIMYGNSAYVAPPVYCNTDQTSGINPNGLSPSSSVSNCIPVPPNMKPCPDGTLVSLTSTCGGSSAPVITTKQCADGSIIDSSATCPIVQNPTSNTKQCADGTIILLSDTCPTQQHVPTNTQTCSDGTIIPTTSTCLIPTSTLQQCSDGSVIPKTSTCQTPSLFKSSSTVPNASDVLNWIIANPITAFGIVAGFLIFILIIVIVTRRK